MAKRLAVVISQAQGRNPAKRQLEEDIVAGLLLENGIDVTVIPNLYDLTADSTGMMALQGNSGNMVVCSWHFERAAHWILGRNDILGQVGETILKNDDEDEEDEEQQDAADEDKDRVIDSRKIPNRKIYCLDLRVTNKADEFIDEVKRIHQESNMQILNIGGLTAPLPNKNNANGKQETAGNGSDQQPSAQERMQNPVNDTALAADGNGLEQSVTPSILNRIEDTGGRRWYPVIDYSRCTNCMECIDFCLFGVYGVDNIDTILVEQPDNCRKGCPACSRVCPENAIMFPQHKTPAIAGANESGAALKIDLSQLFGKPDEGKSADEVAAAERDEQLMLAGREAVGMSATVSKRQTAKVDEPNDELDDLIDQLDDFDL